MNAARHKGLVAGALVVLVAVLLAGGYLFERRMQSSGGAHPPIVAASVASVSPSPISSAIASKAVAPTSASAASPSTDAAGEQVQAAYLHYWDVYSQAMFTLDTSHLSDVAAGDRLQQAIAEVDDLKTQGKAAKTQVQHNIGVFDVTSTTASVHDEYTNNSFMIDPSTKAPMGSPGQPQHLVDNYFLQRMDGVWKVVRGTRESS